jgi:hypothetical protein
MVTFGELEDAFYFVSSSSPGMHSAYLNRDTGEIIYHSEMTDEGEIDDEDLEGDEWLIIPHKNDLDLGQQLVFKFAETHLPEPYDQVRRMFGKPGAYRQYKILIESKGVLESWYEFENLQMKQALKEWCEENDVKLSE